MATTGVVNTTLFTFRAGGSGGTVVSNQNDFSISFTHEPRDTTTKDSGGYRTLLEGLRSYEVSVSGLLAFNDSLSVFTSTTGLNAVLKARTMQTWIADRSISSARLPMRSSTILYLGF
jgi:predicted secreted protein